MTPIPIYPKWGDGTLCQPQAGSLLATTFKNLVPTILHTIRNGTNTFCTALWKIYSRQFINSACQNIAGYDTKLQQLHLYHIHSIHSSKVSTLIYNVQVICFITNEWQLIGIFILKFMSWNLKIGDSFPWQEKTRYR